MAEAKVKKLKYGDLEVGDWIEITKGRAGKIVWKGEVEYETKSGDIQSIGLELVGSVGKHDGMQGGKRYFQCEKDRGMIVQMDRVRKRMKDPTRTKGTGGSSKDLSKIGLSKKTLGLKDTDEGESEEFLEEDPNKGWGDWDEEDVMRYINKRLGNHGELLKEDGFTGPTLVSKFRGKANECKKYFRDKGLNPVTGKSLNRYLQNDLTDANRSSD